MVDPKLLLTHVIPALGVITANLLFLTPLRAALQAQRIDHIGDINPIPYPLIAANCCGWVCYAICTKDPYVFAANALGFLVGLYMTLIALRICDAKMQQRIVGLLLVFAFLLEVVGFVGAITPLGLSDIKYLWGVTANGILLVFNISPLSSLLIVLQTRSNLSIYLPMAVMMLINGLLWVTYGYAAGDAFIWAPNGIGAILATVQLLLYILFRAKPRSDLEELLIAEA